VSSRDGASQKPDRPLTRQVSQADGSFGDLLFQLSVRAGSWNGDGGRMQLELRGEEGAKMFLTAKEEEGRPTDRAEIERCNGAITSDNCRQLRSRIMSGN
jgi:hypothetical protein